MSTSAETLAWFQEKLAPLGPVHALPMFGEYGLYCETKLFALVCDGALFVKITPATAEAQWEQAPPYDGAKPYFVMSEELLEDADTLLPFLRQTLAALPRPKKVPKRLQGLP